MKQQLSVHTTQQIDRDSLQLNSSYPKCFGSNQSVVLCVNKKCKQINKFGCYNLACKCQQLHKSCSKGQINYIIQKIKQKLIPLQTLNQQVQKKIDFLIDQLSNLRQKILQLNKNKIRYIQLIKPQKRILQLLLESKQSQKSSILDTYYVWESINSKQKQRYEIKYEIQKLWIDLQLSMKNNIADFNKNINKEINNYQQLIDNYQDDDLFQDSQNQQALKQQLTPKSIKSQKKKLKSLILFDVKIHNYHTDLNQLFTKIYICEKQSLFQSKKKNLNLFTKISRQIVIDGLVWCTQFKIIPIEYCMNKLRIGCIIQLDKTNIQDIIQNLQAWQHLIQSVDAVQVQML